MVLYAYYKTYGVGKEEPPCEVINIVVMNPSGTCEVFPIPLDENDDIIDTVNQQFQAKIKLADDEKDKQEKNMMETIEIELVV